jgi:two-component system, OmpR family, response regulator
MSDRVLVIEDDQPFCNFLCKALTRADFEAKAVPDGMSALDAAEQFKPNYIVLDMHLPQMDGWKFIEAYFDTSEPTAKIIVSTAANLDPNQLRGIFAYLQKPYTFGQLLALLQKG